MVSDGRCGEIIGLVFVGCFDRALRYLTSCFSEAAVGQAEQLMHVQTLLKGTTLVSIGP